MGRDLLDAFAATLRAFGGTVAGAGVRICVLLAGTASPDAGGHRPSPMLQKHTQCVESLSQQPASAAAGDRGESMAMGTYATAKSNGLPAALPRPAWEEDRSVS